MRRNYLLILLCIITPFYCCATNYTLGSTSLTSVSSAGCSATNYTFSATNNNCAGPCLDPQINLGAAVTITFPAGMDASTVTTGIFAGSAITFITKTATSMTFNTPVGVSENMAFSVVLNNVTNGPSISGNFTISITNNSAGTNSANIAMTTTICPAAGLSNALKYVVYDFEGYDLAATTIPYGAYRYNDINYSIAANPLTANDQIADRCMKVDWNWSAGFGGWGRGMARYIDIDATADYINFYFYNPTTNNKDVQVTVAISEDDNNDNIDQSDPWDGANDLDDVWVSTVTVTRQNNWQLISLPLNTFTDRNIAGNSGGTKGNGIFDAQFSATGGSILKVAFEFGGLVSGDGGETWYMDMISFSEGTLPVGASITDLPNKDPGDYCMLGAFDANGDAGSANLTPGTIEGIFNPLAPTNTRKLCIVNRFILFAITGTTPNQYPSAETQTLINNGYTPMITWEPWMLAYGLYDGNQVTLAKINAGNYDTYIDNFADQIKTYTGTVLIRLMHEMDGDWYPWSITVNGGNAAAVTAYINAFRRIKDRFIARGTTNVKWVFCSNSSPYPSTATNFFVNCYPGDAYVDIVGTDIYNNLEVNMWKSYRFEGAHSIYYLRKHFPSKPIYVSEWGCRERSGELATSESKAQWTARMDKELQSNFSKVRAIIAFSVNKERDWRLNSTTAARDSYKTTIWEDTYYTDACSSTLPINLLYFNSNYDKKNNQINIHWQTSETEKTRLVVLEKSIDGKDFYPIYNSSSEYFSKHADQQPVYGSNYYRLSMKDEFNEVHYSSVIVETIVEEFSWQVYPNPVTDNINFITISDKAIRIEIYTMNGSLLFLQDNFYDRHVALPENIPAGNYLLKIIEVDKVQNIKIIKL